jgi:hypothetical protein
VVDQLNAAFRHAAGQSRAELLALRFRTECCLDKGCPLKNGEADWHSRCGGGPGSLMFSASKQDPRQLGYTVRAEA